MCSSKGSLYQETTPAKICLYMGCQSCLNSVKNKWVSFNSFSDRDLTFKLVIMLILTAASRTCTIHCLDICFMARHAHFVQFVFGKIQKGWKSGKSSPVGRYYEYKADIDLSLQAALDVYLERTKPWRTNQKKQILL